METDRLVDTEMGVGRGKFQHCYNLTGDSGDSIGTNRVPETTPSRLHQRRSSVIPCKDTGEFYPGSRNLDGVPCPC